MCPAKANILNNPNYNAIAQYLFASANSIDTAATATEISDATGVPISTVHRILMPNRRPAGIVESNTTRMGNTRPSITYWYSVEEIQKAKAEYAKSKQLPKEVAVIEMPKSIPNNGLSVTLIDLIADIHPRAREVYDNVLKDNANHGYTGCLTDLINILNDSDVSDERKRMNTIIFCVAAAQMAIDLGKQDEFD